MHEGMTSCLACMYVLSAGLYVCMSAGNVVVVRSVVVVSLLTSVEFGLREVDDVRCGATVKQDPSGRFARPRVHSPV